MKPETPNASHATPHFWREMRMKTLQARQVDLSRLRRCGRPLRSEIGHFADKKGSLRSPRGRLVASLYTSIQGQILDFFRREMLINNRRTTLTQFNSEVYSDIGKIAEYGPKRLD